MAAEGASLRASDLGCEPQPGVALLRMAQGRLEVASAAIARAVDAATEPLHRTKLLPAYIEIMLAAGQIENARRASSELKALANRIDTDVLHALAGHARSALELADGDARTALVLLRRAFDIWQHLEVPYDAARARILLGVACRSLGDTDTAALEFRAARSVLRQLGAAPDLARLDSIERVEASPRSRVLTSRELQVLRLVAAGKTNKSIAREFVAERTDCRQTCQQHSHEAERVLTHRRHTYAYDHKLF